MITVRTRIAPSPSGFLHIGTAKTALYNWLYARKMGGSFILRLEDTDADRTDEKYVQGMCEGFQWLGIDWDEGPKFGDQPERGEFGPYRQSERRELHRREAYRLLAEGNAYKCFCSKEELDAQRAPDGSLHYGGRCRSLTESQIAAMGDRPYVIRFKVPDGQTVVHDLIQGPVCFNNEEYGDFVILKSNGDPIFHLAVVVDDIQMKISHVIRGDDHLTNAGRHMMLFQALGAEPPKFAHHPLVHDEQGHKYSKRLHGANVLDWRADGYLPEAIINYVALLGWTSDQENREFFTLDALREAFTIERMGKSPARFDRKKLDWLNGQHIRQLSPEALRDRLLPRLEQAGLDFSDRSPEWLAQLAALCQEKLPTLNHFPDLVDCFFRDISTYEESAVRKYWAGENILERMDQAYQAMASVAEWNSATIKQAFNSMAAAQERKLGDYVQAVRLALTGKSIGPGLFELAELLGRELCLSRMNGAYTFIATSGGLQS